MFRFGSRAGSRAPGALASIVWLALFAGPASAQGASESGVILGHGMVGAGGTTVSVFNNVAEGGLSQVGSGRRATSSNYVLEDGVSWVGTSVGTDPMVFGPRPGAGDKDGGQNVRVFGFNFQAAGAGPLAVDMGGVPTSGFIVSNTQASVVTPASLNSLGNPVTPIDVDVSNALGAHTAPDSFRPLPAIQEDLPTQVGGTLHLSVVTQPNDYVVVARGLGSTGIGVPVLAFDGALELLTNLQILVNLSQLPSGTANYAFPIPNSQVLEGFALDFQAVSISDLITLTGSFSNKATVTFLP